MANDTTRAAQLRKQLGEQGDIAAEAAKRAGVSLHPRAAAARAGGDEIDGVDIVVRLRTTGIPKSLWKYSIAFEHLISEAADEIEALRRDLQLLSRHPTGMFNTLTPEQQAEALAYRGPENHGPDDFKLPRLMTPTECAEMERKTAEMDQEIENVFNARR